MTDVNKVVQAFALQVYAQSLDIVQQLEPLPATAVAKHENRVNRVMTDVSSWLSSLTPDDLALITDGHAPEKQLNGGDITAYPADAVQMVLERRIRAASQVCLHQHIEFDPFIHFTGKYLSSMEPHKQGWLAERTATLLVAGA